MSFSQELASFAARTKIRTDQVVRKITFDLYGAIVKRTPVDTGLARANWQVGIGQRPQGTLDNDRAASFTNATATIGTVNAGGVTYLVNNLPYIMPLEHGSSTQAPQGMARQTVAEFQAIVSKVMGGGA